MAEILPLVLFLLSKSSLALVVLVFSSRLSKLDIDVRIRIKN